MATITVNQNEAPATVVTESKSAKPSSMRLSPETRAALEDAKYRLGAHSWDECFKSLLDGSASVTLYAADYPSRSEEVRQMGMLLTKTMDLFKLSWTLSSDTEARVTRKMKAMIDEKDNTIAELKSQLEKEAATRAELQEHIEKMKTELDMTRRERDVALVRADTLAQANELNELAELIKAMQSTAKNAGVSKDISANAEATENDDAQEQFSMWEGHSNDEPPF